MSNEEIKFHSCLAGRILFIYSLFPRGRTLTNFLFRELLTEKPAPNCFDKCLLIFLSWSNPISNGRSMSSRRRKHPNEQLTAKQPLEMPSDLSSVCDGGGIRLSRSSLVVFLLFVGARLISARFNNINDCDETFNYWEPAHFMMFGKGFQTWEYSPLYAIRSYFFLWLYMIPASCAKLLFNIDKSTIFYLTRICLALVGALVETFLYRYD